jgi:hypothetical protein
MTLWTETIDAILARLAEHQETAGFIPSLEALHQAGEPLPSKTERQELPVQRLWPGAGAGDPLGRLMALLDETWSAGWSQNPNYRAAPPNAAFLDNYGYLECAGPDAPVRTVSLRVGLLLLGPDTLYPPHHHPAEEVYLPLGRGRWLREGVGWQELPAGAVIHHPPMCLHATQSGAEPLAAIYLWRGDIGPAARID